MRVWPFQAWLSDRLRLLGEHREVHCIDAVHTKGHKGYSKHPEVARWAGHLPALAARHDELVREMARRGWPSGRVHKTPMVHPGPIVWPAPWEPVITTIDKFIAKLCPDSSS